MVGWVGSGCKIFGSPKKWVGLSWSFSSSTRGEPTWLTRVGSLLHPYLIVIHLIHFLNEIKNQFGQVIKSLRNDNAKEYFSSTFSAVLSSHGILHQSTCPHTPQQNGITERKNRDLAETARSLLLSVHILVHH